MVTSGVWAVSSLETRLQTCMMGLSSSVHCICSEGNSVLSTTQLIISSDKAGIVRIYLGSLKCFEYCKQDWLEL